MKQVSALSIALLFTINAIAQPVLNEYKESSAVIQHISLMQPWPQKLLEAKKDAIIKKVGEGMYWEIYNHSSVNVWPEKLSSRNVNFNDATFEKYKAWFVVSLGDNYVIRIPYKGNESLGSGYVMKDKTDFFIVLFGSGISNYSEASDNAKNSPATYTESSYERNYVKDESPGASDYDEGEKEEKKANWKEAIDWYKKGAEKGHAASMHAVGFMIYKNRTGDYSTQKILEESTNPEGARKKRYLESIKWFTKAADKGYAASMYNLGLMYRDGEGVDKNIAKAREWFQKAADKGYTSAQEALKNL